MTTTASLFAALQRLEAEDLFFGRFAADSLDRKGSSTVQPPTKCSCRCHVQPRSEVLFPCPLAAQAEPAWRWTNVLILYSNWTAANVASRCCWCWLHLTPSPAQEALLQRCHDAVRSFLTLDGAAAAFTDKRATFHEHL